MHSGGCSRWRPFLAALRGRRCYALAMRRPVTISLPCLCLLTLVACGMSQKKAPFNYYDLPKLGKPVDYEPVYVPPGGYIGCRTINDEGPSCGG